MKQTYILSFLFVFIIGRYRGKGGGTHDSSGDDGSGGEGKGGGKAAVAEEKTVA